MENIKKIAPLETNVSSQEVNTVSNISGDISTNRQMLDTILVPKINMQDTQQNTDQTATIHQNNPGKPQRKKTSKIVKIVSILIAFIIILLAITGFLSFKVYKNAMVVKSQAQKVKDSFSQKDLNIISSELDNLKKSIKTFESSYSTLSFIKIVPFVSSYYKDGEHLIKASLYGMDSGEILIDSVKPYADIIGLKGSGESNASQVRTAQDKLDFVIKTIPEIVPKIDNLSEKINLINKEVEEIDPDRYPEEVRGIAVRDTLQRSKDLLNTTTKLIAEGKPLLEKSDYFLGVESPRTYMVLFQNDKELRPTGGFITAYTIARVDKGRFDPIISDDIYNLDDNYKPSLKAPEQFQKYLQGIYVALNRFRLRDMNWSPSFEASMEMFSEEVAKAGVKNIDGIIAVDTQMLVYLLDVLGKVSVPGYGDFSTEIVAKCKCPQVIYELESFADQEGAVVWSENEPGKIVFAPENYGERKKIIGPLMNAVLSSTLGLPDSKMPLLFEAAVKSFTEKHVLFYLNDKEAQEAVTIFGIAGDIKEYSGGDYLYINDANLGGRKSNLYVTQEVSQEISKKSGYIEKTLTITYKNPEKQDGWLNSVLPNWVRIYVPKGSEIISNEGFEDFADPYEEFGKQVFAGFIKVRPLGVSKVVLKYKVPLEVDREYKIMIQKQPGKDAPMYTIEMGKKTQEFTLITDKEIRL